MVALDRLPKDEARRSREGKKEQRKKERSKEVGLCIAPGEEFDLKRMAKSLYIDGDEMSDSATRSSGRTPKPEACLLLLASAHLLCDCAQRVVTAKQLSPAAALLLLLTAAPPRPL